VRENRQLHHQCPECADLVVVKIFCEACQQLWQRVCELTEYTSGCVDAETVRPLGKHENETATAIAPPSATSKVR
jgi:hypothetical protein